jgi:thiol-disulfide isomerase/thioredoxin
MLFWLAVVCLAFGAQALLDRGLVRGIPPALEGRSLDGKPFAWEDFQGRSAVIYFWATWCPVCAAMRGGIEAVAADYPLISVALQSGNAEEVSRYVREKDFRVAVLLDEEGSLAERYGLRGVPALFILDPQGRIRFAATGYTSEIGLRLRLWWAGTF